MKDTKDNFSQQSDSYAVYRPSYPKELFGWLYEQCYAHHLAWDSATGNGQAAIYIAASFQIVHATDISISQLEQSISKDNILYNCERAEQTAFADDSFDLITVAQSLHWFDHPAYFNEVKRVAKDGCVFAAWGYNLPRVNAEIEAIVDDFYTAVVGKYWDAERKYVDEQYATIEIPFEALPSPDFSITYQWTLEQFLGYISTWSAVQHYTKVNRTNPVVELKDRLSSIWQDAEPLTFPIFMRAFRITK